jgi:hypothetical protein
MAAPWRCWIRSAASAGAVPIETILAKAPRTLLVMGVDLDSSLGRAAVGPALDKVVNLIYAGPMVNRTSRRASLMLPAAFPFEAAGRALLGPGREVRFGPLLRPPAGVPTIREILAALGARRDETPADVSAAVTVAAGQAGGKAARRAAGADRFLTRVAQAVALVSLAFAAWQAVALFLVCRGGPKVWLLAEKIDLGAVVLAVAFRADALSTLIVLAASAIALLVALYSLRAMEGTEECRVRAMHARGQKSRGCRAPTLHERQLGNGPS